MLSGATIPLNDCSTGAGGGDGCAAERTSSRIRNDLCPRGGCEREPLADDPGKWTLCSACLTLYDDYGTAVNPIPEFAKVH